MFLYHSIYTDITTFLYHPIYTDITTNQLRNYSPYHTLKWGTTVTKYLDTHVGDKNHKREPHHHTEYGKANKLYT